MKLRDIRIIVLLLLLGSCYIGTIKIVQYNNLQMGKNMNCTSLVKDSTECRSPIPGVENIVYLIDRNKLLTYSKDPENLYIEEMIFSSGGYYFRGIRTSVNPSAEVVAGDNLNFPHNLQFIIPDVSNSQKKNIRRLTRGRYIAIVENKDKTRDNVFEVYGLNAGLEMQSGIIREQNNPETNGVFVINLRGDYENNIPDSIWKGDYLTTKAYVIALMLQNVLFNFEDSAGGFTDDGTGNRYWDYVKPWKFQADTNGDYSGVLNNNIQLPELENRMQFFFEFELISIGITANDFALIEYFIDGQLVHKTLIKSFENNRRFYDWFYHKSGDYNLGVKVTVYDNTSNPEFYLEKIYISRVP